YHFVLQPPNLLIDGVMHTKGGKTTRLAIDVDAPTGLDYTFLKKNLSLTQVAGKLVFTHDRLKITGVSASLFGGTLSGEADLPVDGAQSGYVANLRLTNVDFASLTKLYFDYGDSHGHLNGRYSFTGSG